MFKFIAKNGIAHSAKDDYELGEVENGTTFSIDTEFEGTSLEEVIKKVGEFIGYSDNDFNTHGVIIEDLDDEFIQEKQVHFSITETGDGLNINNTVNKEYILDRWKARDLSLFNVNYTFTLIKVATCNWSNKTERYNIKINEY